MMWSLSRLDNKNYIAMFMFSKWALATASFLCFVFLWEIRLAKVLV